jgi:hypothetical protein
VNLKIVSGIVAAVVFLPHSVWAQGPDTPRPSATHSKLDSETIATIPLAERRTFLAALLSPERKQLFQQFLDLPPGGPSNAKINALFLAWATVDPKVAIENARKLPMLEARQVAVEATCYEMKPEAAGVVVQSIKNFPDESLTPQQKERFLGLGIVQWSQADAKAAAEFLSELYPNAPQRLSKPGEGDSVLLTTIKGLATNWGASSPQAALAWFEEHWPQNPVALQSVVVGWWRKEPKAAAAYVNAHTSTPNEREVAAAMAGAMADQDPRAAVKWVEWMKEEKLRRRIRLAIAELWASRAPNEAGTWAQQLPGTESEGVIAVVAGIWTFKDAKAAEQWIDSLQRSKRDAAIRGYARTMARTNPEMALNWVTKMQDAKAKLLLLKAIASEWLERSPEETKAWIKASPLAEAEKQELLEEAAHGD